MKEAPKGLFFLCSRALLTAYGMYILSVVLDDDFVMTWIIKF